ncbi:MAG: spore coat U domain-containing protein [Sulfuricaulis sp.]|uniref:Csu type fimbrial protein n=1 Tax=Sulfuricaulis sp. TaxID=2003553 RepID=UPI0025FCB229|nr:spore coat U domain-containing protein [Sulfuricaulis sp.]MCR4347459.1 spore coat U domain-containing protein [Sulfuricaulis sp.]
MFASLRNKAVALLALCLVPGAGICATTCSLAVGNVAFGGYDVFSPVSLDTSGTLVVTCSRSGGPQKSTVSIAIGPSATSGSVVNRRMQTLNGADFLGYNLFRDAARTSVWGNTAGIDTFVQTIAVPNKGSAEISTTIFGRIPAGQDVGMGVYSDTVTITVTP